MTPIDEKSVGVILMPKFRREGKISERKALFSVSDGDKLDNCLCMKCKHSTCLILGGKSCNSLTSGSKNNANNGIILIPPKAR